MRIFMLTQTTFMDLDKMTSMPSILTLTTETGKGKSKKVEATGWALAVPQEGSDPIYVRSDFPHGEMPVDLQNIIDRIVRSTWGGVEEAIVRIVPLPAPRPSMAVAPFPAETIQ